MQHVNTLITQPLGESERTTHNAKPNGGAMSERLIERLWEKMTAMYGHKWTSAHGVGDDGTWGRVLGGVSPEQLAEGLERCVERDDNWPPTAPEFRKLCLGLPMDGEDAFIRAQQARYAKPCFPRIAKKPTEDEMVAGREALSNLKGLFRG